MIAVPAEPHAWDWRRRLGMIALVFIVQLGLIFGLGSRSPIRSRQPAATLTLRFSSKASTGMTALNDPTLFTLAHSQPFAAPTSLKRPSPELRSFEWFAPTNHLVVALDQVGTVFNRLVETSDFNTLQLSVLPTAAPTLPALIPLALPEARSTMQLEGGLARRQLAAPLDLRSQTNLDILTNTVVQAGVDAEGLPVSVTLLSGSGSAAADQYGLDQAWAARFQPTRRSPTESPPDPTAQTSWGKMVFRWHTVPAPPVAVPALSP